jgi:hypothetical protein
MRCMVISLHGLSFECVSLKGIDGVPNKNCRFIAFSVERNSGMSFRHKVRRRRAYPLSHLCGHFGLNHLAGCALPASLPGMMLSYRQCGLCRQLPEQFTRDRPEALRGHLGELVAVQNHDGTSLQADQSMLGPRAQLLICAFARSADDLADLALRDGDFRR